MIGFVIPRSCKPEERDLMRTVPVREQQTGRPMLAARFPLLLWWELCLLSKMVKMLEMCFRTVTYQQSCDDLDELASASFANGFGSSGRGSCKHLSLRASSARGKSLDSGGSPIYLQTRLPKLQTISSHQSVDSSSICGARGSL